TEAMQDALRPTPTRVRRQLKDNSATTGTYGAATPQDGCTVQISRSEDDAGSGQLPVGSTGEAMQDALRTTPLRVRCQLKDDTTTTATLVAAAPCNRRTVKILPRGIEDKIAVGTVSVASCKCMQHAGRPASVRVRRQLEDRAAPTDVVAASI